MGRKRGSGAAGQPPASFGSSELGETPFAGRTPRFEIPGWRNRFGVVAGITGRGSEADRSFDLGLWSEQPVGEVMNRWLAFRREMADFKAVVLGNQIHGVEVRQVDQGEGWIQVERIDGWITTAAGILLTITIADCIPVYLVAPGRGLALLHAGWRGIAGGILGRGLDQLVKATRSKVAGVIMHCGVGICGDCYEVGSEVMVGCGAPALGPGPWQLDLRGRLVDQARELGISQVSSSPWCSAHDSSQFFSHRASKGLDGRMVAYLGMISDEPLH